ncbi:MAG: hypothetical protein GY946_13825 [bacterium]|nr:hypothetical protein [bacterium]
MRDDAKDGERLAISLSDGRLVQARLVMPAKIPAEVAKRFLAITAIVRSDPSINPLAIAPDELLEREGELIPIWLPEPFDAIRVGSREVRLLPLRTSTHGVGRDLHLSLRPDLISESTTLEVRVVGSNGSQVQGRWPIYVLPISGDGAPQIVAMLTDCAGRLTLPLGVGMYELRTDKSFIVPFSKVQISMAAEENISVAVQIGP